MNRKTLFVIACLFNPQFAHGISTQTHTHIHTAIFHFTHSGLCPTSAVSRIWEIALKAVCDDAVSARYEHSHACVSPIRSNWNVNEKI